MTDLSLSLEGMELLTIQYLLDGKNSEYGYKFHLVGLDKADFSGSRDEEMLDTQLVQQAEEAGDLRKVKFFIEYEESPRKSRAIQLNFFEDGHVTSTSEIRTEDFNQIVKAISRTKSYSNYLISLGDLISDYIGEIELDGKRTYHRTIVNHAFEEIIKSDLDVPETNIVDMHMHKMIISNVGIQLINIAKEESPLDYDKTKSPGHWSDPIQKFFKSYSQYNNEPITEEEYEFMASNINEVLQADTYEGAIDLLQVFIEKYDL